MKKIKLNLPRGACVLLCIGSLCASCKRDTKQDETIPTIDVRAALAGKSTNVFNDPIVSLEYVPLLVDDNDLSLVTDDIRDYAVTSKYIYILSYDKFRLWLFDRQGHYIKDIIKLGNGPGEYSGSAKNIYADEKNDRLYLANIDRTYVYTLEGEFVEVRQRKNMIECEYAVGDDRFAAVSFVGAPFFVPGAFGLGVFSAREDTIAMKKFYVNGVPKEKTGFTDVVYAPSAGSLLFKKVGNDTIYRLTPTDIRPAYILALGNSANDIIKGAEVRNSIKSQPGDIQLYDILETDSYFYYRFERNERFYVGAYNRTNGESDVEQCRVPTNDFFTLARLSHFGGLIGMHGKHLKNPFWGRRFGDELVQVITATEWLEFKEKGLVDGIDVNEDDNPIFVFVKLK
jgi:hypothetical protein